jgi:hypothetical protein
VNEEGGTAVAEYKINNEKEKRIVNSRLRMQV